MINPVIVATRRSPLALAQARLAVEHLQKALPEVGFEVLEVVTTGDKKAAWSLEQKGGKGLFTKELELALQEGEAHVAIHSAKDLPTEMDAGLVIAGYLPREDAHDVMALREGCAEPQFIATGSPRRRAQAKVLFPRAVWSEIRGNVETRLKKIAAGQADATFLAAAGLKRLGLTAYPGLVFRPMPMHQIVPAVGQGAVALQCRADRAGLFARFLDAETEATVTVERTFLGLLGGGCHTATAAHCRNGELMVFHEASGYRKVGLAEGDEARAEQLEALAAEVREVPAAPVDAGGEREGGAEGPGEEAAP